MKNTQTAAMYIGVGAILTLILLFLMGRIRTERYEGEVAALALRMAQMPTKGLALTKRALNAAATNDLNTQLDLEEALQTKAGKTYDFNEGVQAFLEKRAPEFKGE